jgi:murein DD-endopeptidase MepM/ murein hydrolase activator NlpD
MKKITLFVVSNEAGATKKIVISAAWFKIFSISAAILVLILLAGALDYFGLLLQTAENKRLKFENQKLVQELKSVEGKVVALENSLERVKTFTTKLKLITNIEGDDRAVNLSMGSQPPANSQVTEYDQPVDKREPVADLMKKDEESFAALNKMPDEIQGELALDKQRDYKTLAVRIDKVIKDAQLREQSVLDLWETLSEKQSLMNAIPNIRPARGWITSRFGYRISPFSGKPTLHAGLDFAAAPGSPVYAPADGMVSFAGYDEGYGKMITIDHGYGYSTRYAHNAQIYVQVGQRISRWDIIASVGNTGRSTGPHLHYEVRLNGIPRDPANFILDE